MFSPAPLKPKHLSAGNKLGVVTVSAPEAAENPECVKKGIAALNRLGFEVALAPHALASQKGHIAADAIPLAQDVNAMFADPQISGMICSGGGTNSNRLLPFLDYALIRQHPKVIMGLSNPTVVLNAIHAKTGLMTFHGPALVWDFGADAIPAYTMSAFRKAVMDPEPVGIIPVSGDWVFLKPGKASGKLLGGNLWSLLSVLGTEYEPDWNGAILFWEDVGKEPRRIDAMLTHFKLAGIFEKIAGMVVGELVECDASGPSLTVDEIVLDLLKDYRFPVLSGVRLGHTDEKLTLPIGVQAAIDSETSSFTILESAVS
jgi:muramoyltetrapeptide carboxypeptidase